MKHEKIVLLGMMASGKSTLGTLLAGALAVRFVDADHYIADRVGMPIAAYFARHGETAFRRLEREAVLSLVARPEGFVMALGGGAYLQKEIREGLRGRALSVYLRLDADEIIRRLEKTDISTRPVLASPDGWRVRAAELTAERDAAYRLADMTFEAGGRDPESLALELAGKLRALPEGGKE